MSKKKQKKFKDPSNRMERLIFQATFTAAKTGVISGKLDEIIDLLHVLVENTKKPEPVNIGPMVQTGDGSSQRKRQADYQALARYQPGDARTPGKTPTTIAAEEVEDYHGKAAQWPDPYLPVRMRP